MTILTVKDTEGKEHTIDTRDIEMFEASTCPLGKPCVEVVLSCAVGHLVSREVLYVDIPFNDIVKAIMR